MANNEEGNDNCMFNTILFLAPILLQMVHSAQPKISRTSIKNHFKGDLGMANYEKQVEQEAAYPIPISLYNCYRTVRHGHEKRGILLIAFLPLFMHQTCSMLSVGERVHPRCHCGGRCGIRSWRNNFVEKTTTVSGEDWCL